MTGPREELVRRHSLESLRQRHARQEVRGIVWFERGFGEHHESGFCKKLSVLEMSQAILVMNRRVVMPPGSF